MDWKQLRFLFKTNNFFHSFYDNKTLHSNIIYLAFTNYLSKLTGVVPLGMRLPFILIHRKTPPWVDLCSFIAYSVCPFIPPSLSVCLSVCLSVYLSVSLSLSLSLSTEEIIFLTLKTPPLKCVPFITQHRVLILRIIALREILVHWYYLDTY